MKQAENCGGLCVYEVVCSYFSVNYHRYTRHLIYLYEYNYVLILCEATPGNIKTCWEWRAGS